MNEWSAMIWASISAMTAALVLSFVVVLGSIARESAALQHAEDNAIAIMQEYRKYHQYEGKQGADGLYAQDVIQAIAQSRGMPEIWVDVIPGSGYSFTPDWQWTESTSNMRFTTQSLTTAFAPLLTARFDSDLIKDANGAIIRIEFRRQ